MWKISLRELGFMKSLTSIPEEVTQFLSQNGAVSLIVKGAPGTGKSILVLSIIKVLGLTKSFYLTTRVKPQKLVNDLPWLRDILPCENILDATTTIIPARADVEGKISFGILKYTDKPSILRSLYDLIEKVENPFIVIDSIEAIQKVAGEEIFSDLLDLCRELNSKVIFVSEYEEIRKYDYLVDGVIHLKRYIIEGKTLRVMQIEKLRGISCRNPQYLFTLHAGYFKHFNPFKPRFPKEKKRFESLPCSKEFFSTGSKDLDQVLGGGFPKGSTVLVELGTDVEREIYFQLYIPIILNFLTQNKYVDIIATMGTSEEKIVSALSSYLDVKELSNININAEGWRADMLDLDKVKLIRAFDEKHKKEIEIKNESFLFFRSISTLKDIYGEHLSKIMRVGILDTQEKKVLTILTIREDEEEKNNLVSMVDFHIKLEKRNGVPLIYFLKPTIQFYAMETDYTLGYPKLELTPIE